MTYPKPDRSNFTPNCVITEDADVLDFGYAEGQLSDGRPYRLECWAESSVSSISYFMSIEGLEAASKDELADLLVREELIEFNDPNRRHVAVCEITDASDNRMLVISVVIADEDVLYAEDKCPILPY
jgi:hypothetical protein